MLHLKAVNKQAKSFIKIDMTDYKNIRTYLQKIQLLSKSLTVSL